VQKLPPQAAVHLPLGPHMQVMNATKSCWGTPHKDLAWVPSTVRTVLHVGPLAGHVVHRVVAVPAHTPLQQLKSQQSWLSVQEPWACKHCSHFLPLTHTLPGPLQQSVSWVQAWPVCAQQALPWHALPPQHAAAAVHALPVGVQGAHVPLSQMLEQQSLAWMQPALSALQLPQTPL
jgi:hypothetical protein